MQRSNPITIKPVRAIKKAAQYGGAVAVRNALHAIGYNLRRVRHANISRLLGTLPKPDIERTLANLQPRG